MWCSALAFHTNFNLQFMLRRRAFAMSKRPLHSRTRHDVRHALNATSSSVLLEHGKCENDARSQLTARHYFFQQAPRVGHPLREDSFLLSLLKHAKLERSAFDELDRFGTRVLREVKPLGDESVRN